MEARAPDFRALYDEFAPRIRAYLTRLVGEGEAEDLTQEVFARAHRAMATRRGDSLLSTWLYRIATNAAIDRLRAGSRHEVPVTGSAPVEPGIEEGCETVSEAAALKTDEVESHL